MKNILLLLVFSFSISNAFDVHKSNEFTRDLEPTRMSTHNSYNGRCE